MAIRNIVFEGDPCLLKVCRPVTDFGPRLHTLLDDMADTLIEAHGAGLAAPQVGVLRRVALVLIEDEPEGDEEEGEMYFLELINPDITAFEGEEEAWEGCLSLPGKHGRVTRPSRVTVRAQDRDGAWFEYTAEGFEARAFCHEIDHLDGKIYTRLVVGGLYDSDKLPEDDG